MTESLPKELHVNENLFNVKMKLISGKQISLLGLLLLTFKIKNKPE